MARVILLDVNILVALFFPDHVHHDLAHDWFTDEGQRGWATCAVTENGFVRVACQRPTDTGNWRPEDALSFLQKFCSSEGHHFWPDRVSLRERTLFNRAFIRGPSQITDVYLLGLARTMGGRLATFDRTIPLAAVIGAKRDTLAVIGPGRD